MSHRFRLIALAMLALALTTACQRGTSDLERWVASTLQQPAGDIEPIPPITPAEVVSYEAFELRDPFQQRVASAEVDPDFSETSDDGIRPDPNRRREFLEGFPLDTLDMVGTLELAGVEYALIRDNERVVHRVAEDNYLGMNHGRVVQVLPDRVEMIELFQDARGTWSERRAQVAMEDSR